MDRVAGFGRFSRMYTLLAGLFAATVILGVLVLFTDPKPAEAIGETWYGTFELAHKESTTSGFGVYTVNDYARWTAPNDMNNASVYVKIYQHWKYPYQETAPGQCYLSEFWLEGTYTTTGHANFYYNSNYNQWDISPWLEEKPVLWNYKSVGSPECAGTETVAGPRSPLFGNLRIRNAVGTGTACSEQVGHGNAPLPSGVSGCADIEGSTARWSLARNQCSGYTKSWDIGKSDRLFLFNNCQTKSLSARTSWLDDITGKPKVCSYAFVKRLSQACKAYKAVRAVEWSKNDWFLYNAANNGACGVWVVDDASWRPPKIKSATRASDGQGIAWISPGRSEMVKTATGSVRVTCPG